MSLTGAVARACALLCACVLGAPAGAAAAPPDPAAAADAYLDLLDATQVPAGWTGNVEGCVLGAESPASVDATLGAVNRLRDFAGLSPVSFDADLNRKALAAALMMDAADQLSHEPGPGWPCYSEEGDDGAGRSNLFLLSGPAAMVGYVDDSGVPSLGHRRWLIDPRAGTFGTGSTGTANALLVVGGPGNPAPPPEVVAWPPAGYLPWSLVFEDWSAAISVPGSVDLSGARVTVTVAGEPRATSGVTPLGSDIGTGATLKWNVALSQADRLRPADVAVTIDGVRVDGAPRSFPYTLQAFPVLPPAAGRFTAVRSADAVTVQWEAAAERGAPVTGYRIIGKYGDGSVAFDQTTGPEARSALAPFDRPQATLHVSVLPLSRAGSPEVTPQALRAPSGARRSGSEMSVRPIYIRGRRLIVRVRVSRGADGDRMRVKLRGRNRTRMHSARIRRGVARFRIRLSPAHRRAKVLRVVVRYPGNARLRPASRRFVFRR